MACVNRPSALIGLPVELLLLIADFLSPADIACLAVCNHGLMALFASENSASFNGRLRPASPGSMQAERALFLTRLSFDLPEYYLCSVCLRLHLWERVRSPAKFQPLKCFGSVDGEDGDSWLIQDLPGLYYPAWCGYGLHFTHVYLAMRRFHHGPQYGISADSLFHTEVRVERLRSARTSQSPSSSLTPEEKHLSQNKTALTSIEARVCPEASSLCLRIQGLAVVRRQNASKLLPRGNTVWVCGHITNATPDFSERVSSHISAYSSGAPKAAEYGKCSKCNTEWHIELRDLGTHDVTLIFTRWIDVGPGISPEDPRWRSLLLYENEWEVDPQDIIFSPRLRFETGLVEGGTKNTLSDVELYLRNVSFLEEKRYMAVSDKGPAAAEPTKPESRRLRSSSCIIM
jgi:hypothetical protein